MLDQIEYALKCLAGITGLVGLCTGIVAMLALIVKIFSDTFKKQL